jgi:hypothetical protein
LPADPLVATAELVRQIENSHYWQRCTEARRPAILLCHVNAYCFLFFDRKSSVSFAPTGAPAMEHQVDHGVSLAKGCFPYFQ